MWRLEEGPFLPLWSMWRFFLCTGEEKEKMYKYHVNSRDKNTGNAVASRQTVEIDKLFWSLYNSWHVFMSVCLFQMTDSIQNAVSERLSTYCVKSDGTYSTFCLPLPLRPTNRKSLNRATWFFITAVELRSSAAKFSSLPAAIETITPSGISPSATTLKATGRVLLHLQCDGNTLQTKLGESVFTSSPGYSARASMSDRSPLIFRGPALSVAVVMVLQCVNHKSEPREYVWQVWHTTGRWNKMKCFQPTTPLRFWHLLFELVLRLCVMCNIWANSDGRLSLSHAHCWHSANHIFLPPHSVEVSFHFSSVPVVWCLHENHCLMTLKNLTAANFAN